MRLALLTRPIRGFLRWWSGELKALIPAGLRARLSGSTRLLLVELSGDFLIVSFKRGSKIEVLGEVNLAEGRLAERVGRLEQLTRQRARRNAEVALHLPAAAMLRRLVELPAAAAENLREVLEFEMDRFTPFHAEEVHFDYRVAESQAGNRLRIELFVVPKREVAQAMQVLERSRLLPDRLEVQGGAAAGDVAIDLQAGASASAHWNWQQRTSLMLALLAIGLAALIVYQPLSQQQRQLEATNAQLASIRAAAIEVDELKSQLGVVSEQSRLLIDMKRQKPPAIQVLDEVTRLFPDQTWALRFGLQGDEMTVSGYSDKAAGLIGLLEQSPLLTDAHFRSPVTTDPRIGAERFDISARIVGGSTP